MALAHLFNNDGWDDLDESLTYEQKRDRRAAERRVAIRTAWTAGKVDEVKRLTTRVSQPWSVGWSLAEEIGNEAQAEIIPDLLACEDEAFNRLGSAFAAQRIFARGTEWAETVPTESWTAVQTASWAVQMPFTPKTWDWISAHGDDADRIYWERVGSWGGAELSMNEATRAVQHFQKVGRAWDALQFLVSRQELKQVAGAGVTADMVCAVLEAGLAEQTKRQIGTMDSHYVKEALKFLQKQETQADEARIARLEFSFLPLLGPHSLLPKTLQRQLARDPQFFVDSLKLLYRPRSEDGEPEVEVAEGSDEPTELKRERAQRIWQLLHDWQIIPGTNQEGVVDPDALRAWVVEARSKAATLRRSEVCDLQIGEIFAKSPPDADEGMPLKAIRDMIEACKSERLEGGFMLGLHNLRGVFSKSLYEGGKQEREIAEGYERHAKISAQWPRTAKTLRAVAKDYLRQAEQEDERAQARE